MRQVSTNLILSYNSSMYLLLHSNFKKKRTIYSHAHNIKEKFLLTMKPIVSHLFSIGYTINVIIIINPGHVLPASFFLPPHKSATWAKFKVLLLQTERSLRSKLSDWSNKFKC